MRWDADGDGTFETAITWKASIRDTVEFTADSLLVLGEVQLGAVQFKDGGTGNLKFDIVLQGWEEGVSA